MPAFKYACTRAQRHSVYIPDSIAQTLDIASHIYMRAQTKTSVIESGRPNAVHCPAVCWYMYPSCMCLDTPVESKCSKHNRRRQGRHEIHLKTHMTSVSTFSSEPTQQTDLVIAQQVEAADDGDIGIRSIPIGPVFEHHL